MAAENTQQQPAPLSAHRRRGSGRPYQPGQSGNPGGRPRVAAEVKALAQKRGAEAIRTLTTLMRSAEKDEVRVRAAEALLDRAYGRPSQEISAHVTTETLPISDAEWEALAQLRHAVRPSLPPRDATPELQPAATPDSHGCDPYLGTASVEPAPGERRGAPEPRSVTGPAADTGAGEISPPAGAGDAQGCP